MMMEKTKYYQEKDGHIGIKRQKMSQRERARIEEEMRQLISAINETMEERNKTESEKKQQAKHLTTEASTLETKNWDLCNRLR